MKKLSRIAATIVAALAAFAALGAGALIVATAMVIGAMMLVAARLAVRGTAPFADRGDAATVADSPVGDQATA